jgi:hypothetical protein
MIFWLIFFYFTIKFRSSTVLVPDFFYISSFSYLSFKIEKLSVYAELGLVNGSSFGNNLCCSGSGSGAVTELKLFNYLDCKRSPAKELSSANESCWKSLSKRSNMGRSFLKVYLYKMLITLHQYRKKLAPFSIYFVSQLIVLHGQFLKG